jgi:hypothetical protein
MPARSAFGDATPEQNAPDRASTPTAREAKAQPNHGRHVLIASVTGMVLSAAVVLPIELTRHHYAAHRLAPKIFAGVVIWIAFATVIALVLYGVIWLATRE